MIDDDVLHARAPFASRAQQCFAVKSGVDGFLDIARKTFCTTTEGCQRGADIPSRSPVLAWLIC